MEKINNIIYYISQIIEIRKKKISLLSWDIYKIIFYIIKKKYILENLILLYKNKGETPIETYNILNYSQTLFKNINVFNNLSRVIFIINTKLILNEFNYTTIIINTYF